MLQVIQHSPPTTFKHLPSGMMVDFSLGYLTIALTNPFYHSGHLLTSGWVV